MIWKVYIWVQYTSEYCVYEIVQYTSEYCVQCTMCTLYCSGLVVHTLYCAHNVTHGSTHHYTVLEHTMESRIVNKYLSQECHHCQIFFIYLFPCCFFRLVLWIRWLEGELTSHRERIKMGCVASKLDINDVHPNMFAVNNVDDVSWKDQKWNYHMIALLVSRLKLYVIYNIDCQWVTSVSDFLFSPVKSW